MQIAWRASWDLDDPFAPAPPAPPGACPKEKGVQYTKPDHYKQASAADADACCALCRAEPAGACGSWKFKADGQECKLLATAPTAKKADSGWVSGVLSTAGFEG